MTPTRADIILGNIDVSLNTIFVDVIRDSVRVQSNRCRFPFRKQKERHFSLIGLGWIII